MVQLACIAAEELSLPVGADNGELAQNGHYVLLCKLLVCPPPQYIAQPPLPPK